MTLTVSNLSVLRASRHLLSGVGFEVSAGQALILRGPNGLGKTTLLRTIAGLQPVHEGQVDMPEDMAVYAGHLDGIKSTLTVRENLEFWASVFGTGSIDAAIAVFDLDQLIEKPRWCSNSEGRERVEMRAGRPYLSGGVQGIPPHCGGFVHRRRSLSNERRQTSSRL